MLKALSLTAAVLLCAMAPLRAEVTEIRIARQFSMGFTPFALLDKYKLIEKHGKAAGLDLTASQVTFNGPSAVNDALISGNVEIVGGGIPGMLSFWAKTRGTAQEVRAMAGLVVAPSLLLTRKPEIKTIADFTETDRIAMSGVGNSTQAVILQVASAKLWGAKEWARLNPLTVNIPPADAAIGIKTGSGGFDSAFATIPYAFDLAKSPGVHVVLRGEDVVGPHSITLAYTSKRFHDANPRAYRVILDALAEAADIATNDPEKAAEAWIESNHEKLSVTAGKEIMTMPGVRFTSTPTGTRTIADFMTEVGALKVKVESWQDYFFPEIYALPGS